ncbi:MAG: hypothetical protein JST12_17305 [Armatimonadetes bacterium]|nr:hypothetical protein [Armatimonadota bacterium]MBS1727507.1 hypothetical protein [Armatimonadota bacterium]
MESIGDLLKEWQTFYFTLAGATATLMGLLFVSLSLHANQIHDEENSHFLRLARLTFSNYLMLLTLSLQMLVPMRVRPQLIIPMAAVGVIGLFWTITLRNRGLKKSDPTTPFLRRSYYMAFASYAVVLALSLIRFEIATLMYLLLTPIMLLTVTSVRNSWGLMMMLRTKSD